MQSVTIGIPAYNEEANIGYLLRDILSQSTGIFILKKIIVVSDGSTDETASVVQAIQDNRIALLDDGMRKGQAPRQNEIIQMTNSDILVLLNADIALVGNQFLENLVRPILESKADLTSVGVEAIKPETLMEDILVSSLLVKNRVFESYHDGNNIYTCVGIARAFSRRFYKQFHFRDSVGEDAYSYLSCISEGFNYKFVKEARVVIKIPDTLKDYLRQSKRFYHSKLRFQDIFGTKAVERAYALPKRMLLKSIPFSDLRTLWNLFLYAGVLVYAKGRALFGAPTADLWEISTSSKNLRKGKL